MQPDISHYTRGLVQGQLEAFFDGLMPELSWDLIRLNEI